MGLDVSHDAYSGGYISFMAFRVAVVKAMGGKFEDGEFSVPDEFPEGMYEFFAHSDCDGEISPEVASKIADAIEPLLPKLDADGMGGGHIARNGGFGAVARQWIAGCRAAAAANEPLEFM